MNTVLLTSEFVGKIPQAISNDTNGLATASHAPTICPILNNITPTPETSAGDLVLSNDVLEPVVGTIGAQTIGWDPVKQQWFVEILAPSGGWQFSASDAPVENFEIYGWALLGGLSSHLYGVQMFDEPVTMYAGQGSQVYDVGPVRFYVDQLGIG